MKKSILSIILSVVLVFVMSVTLIACNDNSCSEHIDDNNDLKCDNCGADLSKDDDGSDDDDNGGEIPDETETYTFTLKDQNNAGVADASIEFTVNGKNPITVTTDANGVATTNLAKNAILIQAEIVDWDSIYIIDETGPFTFEGTKNFVYDDVIKQNEYVISVVDHNGAPVEGATVQLCFGSICKTPKNTSKLGKATIFATEEVTNAYVSINALPSGYSLKDEGKLNTGSNADYAKYSNFTNNEITIVVDKLNVVTISAGDLFGSRLKDIKIDVYLDSDDTLVTSAVTSASGSVEFILPDDDYYFKAYHKDNNPTYVWIRHEEGMQPINGTSIITEFIVRQEVTYTFNATRTTSDYNFNNVGIRLLNRLFEEVYVESSASFAEANFDANGVATIVAPYDVYYAEVYGLQSNCSAALIEMAKDGTTTYAVSIVDGEAAGSAQNPIVLLYGDNSGYTMTEGEVLTFKVIKPSGAVLNVDGANVKVVIDESEYVSVSNTVSASIGSEEAQIITIEAKEDVMAYQWSISVLLDGTIRKPYEISESEIDATGETIEVDLSKGKAHYTFYATNSDATLMLSSSDNVKFYIDGTLTNSAPVANNSDISFYVVGEGEVSFTVTYQPRLVNYVVLVTKESALADGISVDLIHDGNIIATKTSVGGYATFNGIPEYVLSSVYASVKTENVPAGYAVNEDIVSKGGAYFQYELTYDEATDSEIGIYTTGYRFDLIRDGSQNAPYEWHNEGITGMPTETFVELGIGEEVYYDFFGYINEMNKPTYYVYARGNQQIYMYKDNDGDGSIDLTTAADVMATYNDTKNATWMEVPIGENVIIKIVATNAVSFKLRCGTVIPDLTESDEYAGSGTKNDPYTLKFNETITTPNFIVGTLENPGVEIYYYKYIATANETIKLSATKADISVFVNGILVTDCQAVEVEEGETKVLSATVEAGDTLTLEIRVALEAESYEEAAVFSAIKE